MFPYPHRYGQRVRVWDYKFDWTPDHLSPGELRPLMFSCDELASRCLNRLDLSLLSLKPKTGSGAKSTPDVYELLRERASEDEALRELWRQVHTVPDWVDWEQLERGQRVFYRYAGPCIIGLTFQSLLGGMASPRVAETLSRTGGFGIHSSRRRLLSTFKHILSVTHSLSSIQPGGEGFVSTLRVRLLHASVRRRILTSSSSPYPIDTHGVPISDLDTLATAHSFSSALIWLSLPKQGIYLRRGEIADYLAFWRYLSYLLGSPADEFFFSPSSSSYYPHSSTSTALITLQSLLAFSFPQSSPSSNPIPPTSPLLASNLLTALSRLPTPLYSHTKPDKNKGKDIPPGFLHAQAHWLNGIRLATALGVPKPAWYWTLLVGIQCVYLMWVCYTRRSVARWDAERVARLRVRLRGFTEGLLLRGEGGEGVIGEGVMNEEGE